MWLLKRAVALHVLCCLNNFILNFLFAFVSKWEHLTTSISEGESFKRKKIFSKIYLALFFMYMYAANFIIKIYAWIHFIHSKQSIQQITCILQIIPVIRNNNFNYVNNYSRGQYFLFIILFILCIQISSSSLISVHIT